MSWREVMSELLAHEGAEGFSAGLRERALSCINSPDGPTIDAIGDVAAFNRQFGLPVGEEDLLVDVDVAVYRLKFILEEAEELEQALGEGDRVGAFDALIDLAYVTLGTALFMGVTPDQWRAGWAEVQRANMSKVKVPSKNESKRGSAFDVIKPAGWVAPEAKLKEILNG